MMGRPACPAALALLLAAAAPALAHDAGSHAGGIAAEAGNAGAADFDIVHARVTMEDGGIVFRMAVSGSAGETRPTPAGALAGSEVFAYVWPTSIDPYEAGFDEKAGILAMAVTSHPDFDDTPLQDENGDGDPGNDGDVWHSHWVVLGPDEACGAGALKVDLVAVTDPDMLGKAVVSYNVLAVQPPVGCERRLTGYQGADTLEDMHNYRIGCETRTAISKMIVNPEDLQGRAGTVSGDSRRQGTVTERYMGGEGMERLDTTNASGIGR